MQKPSVEGITDYLRFCQDREANATIMPQECKILVRYIDELHAVNITLAQALSEVED